MAASLTTRLWTGSVTTPGEPPKEQTEGWEKKGWEKKKGG